MENKDKIRLNKFLASRGIASRRKIESLIVNKKVIVNGKTAILGDKIDPDKDTIKIDGIVFAKKSIKKYYLALYKPCGYVTTLKDEFSRKCIVNLTKKIESRVYPVGRLDKESEGLIFLTNDGAFANAVMHPSYGVEKEYVVVVSPRVYMKDLNILRSGVIYSGEELFAKKVDLLKSNVNKNCSVLRIILSEGKNRHIRKMCAAVGLKVVNLKRVSIGVVKIGNLKEGEYRSLTKSEVDYFVKK